MSDKDTLPARASDDSIATAKAHPAAKDQTRFKELPKPDNLEEKARECIGKALSPRTSNLWNVEVDLIYEALVGPIAALLRSTVAEAVKEKDEWIAKAREIAARARVEEAHDYALLIAQARRDGASEMREAAASLMTNRKVTASEFYATAIRALPLPEGGE